MGRGDKRSKRGKISRGTYGKSRLKPKHVPKSRAAEKKLPQRPTAASAS